MVELIIQTQLSKRIMASKFPLRFISMRRLSRKELDFLREKGIQRYYMPCLDEPEERVFGKEFEKFWDGIVRRFGPDHYFWRNAVSSKMQEWERSLGYLVLTMFTLGQVTKRENLSLLVIVDSLEEMDVWKRWAKEQGWAIVSEEASSFRWAKRFQQELKNTILFLFRAGRCLRKKYLLPPNHFSTEEEQKSLLMISLYYPWSFQNGMYRDPFWGELHRFFEKKKFKVTFLCDSLVPVDKSLKKLLSDCHDVTMLNPFSLISTRQLLMALWRVFVRKIKVPKAEFQGCDFSQLLCWYSRRFSHDFHLEAEIYYLAVLKLCRQYPYERLLQIYEGNVNERACIQAFRQHSSSPVVGYSQGVVYDSNLKLRLSPQELVLKPLPDYVVCTGGYAKELLSRTRGGSRTDLRSGCVLRELPFWEKENNPQVSEKKILVALDGTPNTNAVLDWLIENADILKDYQVCIRAHPNVPLESVVARCVGKLPENFYASEKTLSEDLKGCLCVLYRHTSIGMQALMNIIPAVHLAIDSPLSGDPIKEIKLGKWEVRAKEDLSVTLKEIENLSDKKYRQTIGPSLEILREYFTAPFEERFIEFLEGN